MFGVCDKPLKDRLRAKTASSKTPLLARFPRGQASPSGRQNTSKMAFQGNNYDNLLSWLHLTLKWSQNFNQSSSQLQLQHL